MASKYIKELTELTSATNADWIPFQPDAASNIANKISVANLIQVIGTGKSPTTWYVDKVNGNDANNGSTGFPLKTITAAIAAKSANDTILVAPGVYSESIVIDEGCTIKGLGITGTPYINGTVAINNTIICSLETLQVDTLVQGTAASVTYRNVKITNSIPSQIGESWFYDCVFLSSTICSNPGETSRFYNCEINSIATSGTHTSKLFGCDTTTAIVSGTTGVMDIFGGSVGTMTHNTGGTVTLYGTQPTTINGTAADPTFGITGNVLAYDASQTINEKIDALGTASQLSDLTDVNTSTPTNRNVLVADGVDWESRALTEADISDLQSYLTSTLAENVDGNNKTISDLREIGFQYSPTGDNGPIILQENDEWLGIRNDSGGLTWDTKLTVGELYASRLNISSSSKGFSSLPRAYFESEPSTGNYISLYAQDGLSLKRLKVGTPTEADDATTKTYVDSNTIGNVVEDTTPQLGGNLDVNGNKIVSVSNGNIDIEPNGTGNVLIGNFTFDADQTVGASQDNYVLKYNNSTGLISLEIVEETIVLSLGDYTSDIAVNPGLAYWIAPWACTVTSVIGALLVTAPTGSSAIFDLNKNGTTMMTTNKMEIEVSENSTLTATTQPTLTTTAIAQGDIISADIDQIGSVVAGVGPSVTIIVQKS